MNVTGRDDDDHDSQEHEDFKARAYNMLRLSVPSALAGVISNV